MYYGKGTERLDILRKQYEQLFGFDPNGEMDLEFGEEDYDFYCDTLTKCIETEKDIFEVLDL